MVKITIFMMQPLYRDDSGKVSCDYGNLLDFVMTLQCFEQICLGTIVMRGKGKRPLDVGKSIKIMALAQRTDTKAVLWKVKFALGSLRGILRILKSEEFKDSE